MQLRDDINWYMTIRKGASGCAGPGSRERNPAIVGFPPFGFDPSRIGRLRRPD